MQQGKINVQTENIFPIIKKFLYSEHEIFLGTDYITPHIPSPLKAPKPLKFLKILKKLL